MRIEPLQALHVPETAMVLAQAMEVDSAYRYLFARHRERAPGLRRLFAGNLRTHLTAGCTFVAIEAERVVATATLRPLGGVHISPWRMLRSGLLPFAWEHGVAAVRRMLWLKQHYDGLEAQLGEGQPHFFVHMMAVVPDRQGQGVGGELLAHVLEQAGALRSEHSCVLTTHLPRNLPFYQRAGFELAWEQEVRPPGGEPYPVWGMRRPGNHRPAQRCAPPRGLRRRRGG